MRLTARLRAVLSLVPPGSRVADIGADHARLATALVAEDRARAVVATEVDRLPSPPRGALARSRGRLLLRRGPGLTPLHAADALDVLVLAGLGARTVGRILDEAELRRVGARRLVLQAQSETWRLRAWARDTGRFVVDERGLVDRGRWYEVLAVAPDGGPGWDPPPGLEPDDVLEAGPVLLRARDAAVRAHWRRVLAYRRTVAGRAARAIEPGTTVGVERAARIVSWLDCYTRWSSAEQHAQEPR